MKCELNTHEYKQFVPPDGTISLHWVIPAKAVVSLYTSVPIIPTCNKDANFVILLQVYVAGNNRYLVQQLSIKNFYNTGGK